MSLSAVLCRHAGIVGYWFSFLLSCKVVYYDSSASPIAPSLSSSFVARVRTLERLLVCASRQARVAKALLLLSDRRVISVLLSHTNFK